MTESNASARLSGVGKRAGGLAGVLVVAKPAGPTSHDVVGLVRRLSGTRRIGHGGTLDPFANGVLPLFLGPATRLAEFHLGERKAYRATVCFGGSSTTDDLEGELTPVAGPVLDRERVEAALEGFRGPIVQRPPSFSARKVHGRRAYALARAGRTPELSAREVVVLRLELLEWDASDPERPIAVLDVECSAGTYVRALARDLGSAIGSAAYLGALTRTASGSFRLSDAITLDAIRVAAEDGPEGVRHLLLPVDAGLDRFPAITLGPAEVADVVRGRLLRPAGVEPGPDPVRLRSEDGTLVALGRWRGTALVPDKVLVERSPETSESPATSAVAAASKRAGG